MSTPNFAFENILITRDHEDVESFEMFDQPELQNELAEAFPQGEVSHDFYHDGLSRSYGGKEIFKIYFHTKDEELYKKITVLYRGGYYSGMNIDYIVSDSEFDPVASLDKKIASSCKKIEKILRKYGTELTHVGTFSNGEAVYELKK